jgi:hypothetical protein
MCKCAIQKHVLCGATTAEPLRSCDAEHVDQHHESIAGDYLPLWSGSGVLHFSRQKSPPIWLLFESPLSAQYSADTLTATTHPLRKPSFDSLFTLRLRAHLAWVRLRRASLFHHRFFILFSPYVTTTTHHHLPQPNQPPPSLPPQTTESPLPSPPPLRHHHHR